MKLGRPRYLVPQRVPLIKTWSYFESVKGQSIYFTCSSLKCPWVVEVNVSHAFPVNHSDADDLCLRVAYRGYGRGIVGGTNYQVAELSSGCKPDAY